MKPKSSRHHRVFCPGFARFLPRGHQAGPNAERPTLHIKFKSPHHHSPRDQQGPPTKDWGVSPY